MNEHDADTPYKRSDTEEVRSSNLLTPTINSQLRGIVSELLSFCPQMVHAVGPQTSPGNRRVFPPPALHGAAIWWSPCRAARSRAGGSRWPPRHASPWWRSCRTCQKLADGLREVIGSLYSPRKNPSKGQESEPMSKEHPKYMVPAAVSRQRLGGWQRDYPTSPFSPMKPTNELTMVLVRSTMSASVKSSFDLTIPSSSAFFVPSRVLPFPSAKPS